ncbi:2-oxyglutarate/Fe(II) oxygenase [Nitzschia inconspicua]|uniref:2-oxyglutarate/Fe(II) oxygenase n=1 Tax=Nitzschia inconspicua TaxID=303405 RepID=A0A9K3LNK4_9STRA|nr:2-oxyglutarate/Fe(II) oxygenase [Nitzschia inconspicua]
MDTSGLDKIPVINLSQDDATIVNELMTAFTIIGFATLVNHGVPQTLRQQTFSASELFFQLPLSQKLQYQYIDQASNRGYIRCGSEHHDDYLDEGKLAETDCKETMDIGWDSEEGYENRWPKELPDTTFKNVLLEYFETMDKLQLRLMKYVAMGLGLAPDYLVQRCNGHHENLRLLHYPSTNASGVRGNAHTDFGTLTLLVQDQVGGLKVQRTDGTWINVEPTENSIIVNVGDMLMRWSNDKLKATLHKVEAPPHHGGDIVPERYSIAFFCNANKDVELKCLDTCCNGNVTAKYPPINAHKYITQRLLETINTTPADSKEDSVPTNNKLISEVGNSPNNGTSTISDIICRVCHKQQAKYTCPRCERPYCSLDCYRNHNNSTDDGSNEISCTEEFYKTKVNALLSLERKEHELESNGILNRHYQQQFQGIDIATEDNDIAAEILAEEELYRLWSKLEELGEDANRAQLEKVIPPSLRKKLQYDLQQGTAQQLVLRDWFPWWRQQLVVGSKGTTKSKMEKVKRSEPEKSSKTLDERLLKLQRFELLSLGRQPSPLLVFNLMDILYSVCGTLRLYHGIANAIANEPLEAGSTLVTASAVLAKDARFSSLSEVLIHCTSAGKGHEGGAASWNVLVEDVAYLVESHRLVGRALLEAFDILTAARREVKRQEDVVDKRQRHQEQIKQLSALRKKIEFFLSWSQHPEIKTMLKETKIKDEILSWREQWMKENEPQKPISPSFEDVL